MDQLLAAIEAWNLSTFLAINASADTLRLTVAVGKAAAEQTPFLLMALLVVGWIWGDRCNRAGLISVTIGTVAALVLSQAVQAAWVTPRPFVLGIGTQLLEHRANASFPSDHAVFGLAIGFGLLAATRLKRLAAFALVAALTMAWARIFVGIHFPVDMAGALALAAVGAGFARLIRHQIERRFLPHLNGVYGWLLDFLRIPKWLISQR